MSVSVETLLNQAFQTADQYLAEDITKIDKRLGKGYAKKNPVLVGVFIQTAAKDFSTVVLHKYLSEFAKSLDNIDNNIHRATP